MNEIDRPDVLAEVDAAFDAYEKALVTNDVAMLDALFFDSPHTVRYGATENLYGCEAIRAFRAARPGKGLARTVTARVVTTYGDAFAVTHIEFRREGEPRIGRQSQTWVKMPEGWRVVSAHVSWIHCRDAPTDVCGAGRGPLRRRRRLPQYRPGLADHRRGRTERGAKMRS